MTLTDFSTVFWLNLCKYTSCGCPETMLSRNRLITLLLKTLSVLLYAKQVIQANIMSDDSYLYYENWVH